ncbi:hypothetical protein [Streptomyces iconiensis]|uniref:Uncharacterized protein n=1 Tax=Streptomyces iconiensis TaxID=1384038 RepID=A0ABT7A4L8_9ACTN|nr:hypothetical protein [Streptomyces iconiensis]MDJ1136231.1 hypothetical protein [Streptomyces iconiensis]
MATTTRYQVRPLRVVGAYVLDTHTGNTWTGFAWAGARSLADHLNRAARTEADAVTAEAQLAAELVTKAEATDGTWHGAWIGAQQDDGALFAIERDTEQGALFA